MQPSSAGKLGIEELLFRSSLALAASALAVCTASFLLVGDATLPRQHPTGLPKLFAVFQDIPVAAAMIVLFMVLALRPQLVNGRSLALRPWHVISIVLAMALTAWLLRVFVLFDFDLSRDEQMVAFDSAIFGKGQLFAPVPPEWREWYHALNSTFLLPIGDREGWLSGYQPGNAAIHAALEQVMPPSLVSPLLLSIAGLALWRIARLIWPDSPATHAIVMLLFAGSSQVILMASTRYAMTAHLTMNLCWLWLFLQRRSATHAAAIGIGFIATGLHQPLFHPIFVLPFLDVLRQERRWRLLAVYVLAYAAIGMFWLAWPVWVSSHGIHPVPQALQSDGINLFDRLQQALWPFTSLSFGLIGVNLLRFFAWQHLLLLPLAIVGLRAAFSADPLCRALALGMVLLTLAMLVLMPTQTHGWGYRYMHGFIGSAVLIAGFGWHRLERDGVAPVRTFLLATALSLLILVPIHVWMARSFVKPYAEASAALARLPADLVVVDTQGPPFGTDFVRNRADLGNRPIMLQASQIDPSSLPRLCAGGRTLAFADRPRFAAVYQLFNAPIPQQPGNAQQRLRDAAQGAGCRIVPALPAHGG